MRQNKDFSVIAFKKYEEPEQQYHCKDHPGCRMIRLADGLRCQICGSPYVATRTVMTIENKVETYTKEIALY